MFPSTHIQLCYYMFTDVLNLTTCHMPFTCCTQYRRFSWDIMIIVIMPKNIPGSQF